MGDILTEPPAEPEGDDRINKPDDADDIAEDGITDTEEHGDDDDIEDEDDS